MAEIDYEAQRLENLAHKQRLLDNLNLKASTVAQSTKRDRDTKPAAKKRRVTLLPGRPQRSSARLATSDTPRRNYNEDEAQRQPRHNFVEGRVRRPNKRASNTKFLQDEAMSETTALTPPPNTTALIAGWSAWTPTAPPPTRDPVTQTFQFPSHPLFTPNKSPSEVLHEGAFGGTYFRPYRSRRLGITITEDWRELPETWTAGLDISRYLISPTYHAEANKFQVAAGQDIEAWEAAGWINYDYDIRGWFQWYCRFFRGRRCEDDERQVARWRKCVGETGRWRRALLKKYAAMGVREVWDDEGDETREVSPVMHQTCHHWAWEVRQEVLDEFWRNGGR